LSAQPSSAPLSLSPNLGPASPANASSPRGFLEFDDRLHDPLGTPGVILACTSSPDAAVALAAHVARRMRARGYAVVQARRVGGTPLWREAASRLGLVSLDCDPLRCAEQVAAAAVGARAALVVPLPAAGTWDRAVVVELALTSSAPLVVLVTDRIEPAKDIRAERFDVRSSFDESERRRWWAAVADDADNNVPTNELAALESWWHDARHAPVAPAARRANHVHELPRAGRALLTALGLAERAWPEAEANLFSADEGAVAALLSSRAVQLDRGWLSIDPAWEEPALAAGSAADPKTCAAVARALALRFHAEPWAHARAAELLLRAGEPTEADREHGIAVTRAADSVARREIVSRWMADVDALSSVDQLTLRMRAAERALAFGEADEAYRWAQTASALAPDDSTVTLLLGRSAVALGDLVAAKVALERGQRGATSHRIKALIAVELGETAYLGGDLAGAKREAHQALTYDPEPGTALRARNTLGKILIAEAKWDEADRHFTEDAQFAISHGDTTGELRARLNRGIALLSNGQVDEARATFDQVLLEGERIGDMRACAFALDHLAVVATTRHEYAKALGFAERTLKLRQRLGDRLMTARILANLAILRCKLGLLDHADHAIAFGRHMLGPGMPPALSAHLSVAAGCVALARGNHVEARREIATALVDSESAHVHEYIGAAHRLAARLALEDGDLGRARRAVEAAEKFATTDEWRAEVALLSAMLARASGESAEALAREALTLARLAGEEELLREVNVLLSEVYRASENFEAARQHLEHALLLRDQIAEALPDDIRAAFLARPDVANLQRLHAQLATEPEVAGSAGPATQRAGSSRPPSASAPRELIGEDPTMRGLMAAIKKVSRSSSTVLIRGESGTGKELVAEALHRASERASGPMVTVNCAALVETLLLSELFGHEKGAFTGAFTRRRGRFELAEGGTLFLDEIGDISPKTQVALLRVLQERTFERVGGTTPIRVNVRIICATHRDLRAMVERGDFREDLYYRLRGITLEVPPLRLRMGDLPRIAEHLLARIAVERAEAAKSLSPDAVELLARHRWSGNVRELENALRAASLFADGNTITAANLVENVDDLRSVASVRISDRPPPQPSVSLSRELLDGDSNDDEAFSPVAEESVTSVAYSRVRQGAVSLSDIKRQIERDCIARALAETKGNITRAAALLGMKRPRLSQLVKQYGLAAVSSEAL
jgi:transcriptional regulator with GAF, ATPase, and Fis domain/tetratricopeptide (TPR) repeat protein